MKRCKNESKWDNNHIKCKKDGSLHLCSQNGKKCIKRGFCKHYKRRFFI